MVSKMFSATESTEPFEKKLLNLCELCGLTHYIRDSRPFVVEKTGPFYLLLEFIIHKTALARDHNGLAPTVDL